MTKQRHVAIRRHDLSQRPRLKRNADGIRQVELTRFQQCGRRRPAIVVEKFINPECDHTRFRRKDPHRTGRDRTPAFRHQQFRTWDHIKRRRIKHIPDRHERPRYALAAEFAADFQNRLKVPFLFRFDLERQHDRRFRRQSHFSRSIDDPAAGEGQSSGFRLVVEIIKFNPALRTLFCLHRKVPGGIRFQTVSGNDPGNNFHIKRRIRIGGEPRTRRRRFLRRQPGISGQEHRHGRDLHGHPAIVHTNRRTRRAIHIIQWIVPIGCRQGKRVKLLRSRNDIVAYLSLLVKIILRPEQQSLKPVRTGIKHPPQSGSRIIHAQIPARHEMMSQIRLHRQRRTRRMVGPEMSPVQSLPLKDGRQIENHIDGDSEPLHG